MGGVPENGEGTERVYTWGGDTANRKTTAEREGWEVVLSLTGGGHEGGGAHRRPNVHKQKAEHSHAVYCYATASGTLRGGDAERGSAGNTEVVGSDGHRLGEGQGEGSGNGISVRIGEQTWRGRRRRTQKAVQADQVGWNEAE